jgi:hypothetical protein
VSREAEARISLANTSRAENGIGYITAMLFSTSLWFVSCTMLGMVIIFVLGTSRAMANFPKWSLMVGFP